MQREQEISQNLKQKIIVKQIKKIQDGTDEYVFTQ